MASPAASIEPLGAEPFTLVDAAPESDGANERREDLYALFDVPGRFPAYTQPEWAEAVRAQRALFGSLFLDRVLAFAVDSEQVAELYPPTSAARLHALIDLIDGATAFSKPQCDAVIFYLLLALFPSPAPACGAGQGRSAIAAVKAQRASHPAHNFAHLVGLPPPLRRAITAYALLDQGLFDRAVGYMRTEEVEFTGEMLAIVRALPDDYEPSAVLSSGSAPIRAYALGEYRSRVLVSLVDTLSLDLPQAWMEEAQNVLLNPSDTDVLKDAQDNWVAHAAALSLAPGRGPWAAWQETVEGIPNIKTQLEEHVLLELGDGHELGTQVVLEAVDDLQVAVARAVWESGFAPTVRPRVVEELLSMPMSPETAAALKEAVLKPSPDLGEVARLASGDTLLARAVADVHYVEALRLDAKLGGFESTLAVPGARRAALTARRRDLIRGVRSILPQISRQKVDAELSLGLATRDEELAQPLQMSWENVEAPGQAQKPDMEDVAATAQPLSTALMSIDANADPQTSLLDAIQLSSATGPRSSSNNHRISALAPTGEPSSSFIPGYLSRTAALSGAADTTPTGDVSNTSLSQSRSRTAKPRSSTHEAFSDPANISMASLRSRSHAGDQSNSFLAPEHVLDPVLDQPDTKTDLAWGQGLPADPLPTFPSAPPEPQPSQVPLRPPQPRISLTTEDAPAEAEAAMSRVPRRSEPMSKLPPAPRTRRSRAPRKVETTASPDDAEEEAGKKTAVPARRFARAAKTRKTAPPSAAPAPAQALLDEPPSALEPRGRRSIPGTLPGMFPGMDEGGVEAEPSPAGEVEMREVPRPRRTSPRRKARAPEFEPRPLTADDTPRKQPSRRTKRSA